MPTVTKDTVQLVFGQEGKPVDTFLLVLPELCVDLDGDLVRLDFAAIEQLREELAFFFTLPKKILREVWWVWETGLGIEVSAIVTV